MPANPAPAPLLALAEAAVLRNFDRVYLGFSTLGADFPAPIGWLLHLTRVEGESGVRIEMQASEGAPEAYMGGDWQDPVYWGEAEIRTWIEESPAPPAVDNPSLAVDWELMARAYGNGWELVREVRSAEQAHLNELRRSRGDELLPPAHASFEASAVNYFYNIEGHPDHRDTGAPVSVTAALVGPAGAERAILHRDGHGGATERGTRQDFEEMVSAVARWFVPVAQCDDDTEEWVLPAEATAWKDATG